MAFCWKDRDGAVNQAAYQFRKSRQYVLELIQKMTPEDIENERVAFGNPEWTPRFDQASSLLDCAQMVLGGGSRFQNYFCLDPESMSARQWTQFQNDVQKEIDRRDHMDAFLAERKARQPITAG